MRDVYFMRSKKGARVCVSLFHFSYKLSRETFQLKIAIKLKKTVMRELYLFLKCMFVNSFVNF